MRITIAIIVLLLAAGVGYWAYREGLFLPAPERATEEAAPEIAQGGLTLPRFGVVRVNRSGFASATGTGEAGAAVALLVNGEGFADTTVGPDGAWAVSTRTPLMADPAELTLRQTGPEGGTVLSEDTVIVVVSAASGAPIVLRTMPGGATELLQRAEGGADTLGPLGIETVDYDASNAVIFAGRATPGATVQISLDGVPLGAPTSADERGRWEVSAEILPGRYRLRAVQFGEDGRIAHMSEVPFERVRDEGAARANAPDVGVTVQPGDGLWVVSRAVYGEGRQYTILFAANAGG